MSIKSKTLRNSIFAITLLLVAIAGIYLARFSNLTAGKLFVGLSGTGVIYEAPCEPVITKTKICKITMMSKTKSHAVARIHYQYSKGKEDKNKINVMASKGSFDNTVGVREYYSMAEGENSIDAVFGLFKPEKYTKDNPYVSDFLTVEVRGIDLKSNFYIRPSIINLTSEYHQEWYSE